MELLLLLAENYEEEAFPIDLPDPITAIRFRMDQPELKPKDLIPFIGSKSKVSDVVSGRRTLSLTMIRKSFRQVRHSRGGAASGTGW